MQWYSMRLVCIAGYFLNCSLNTWPYHLSRFCLRKVSSMLASLQISSFLMWSFLVLPLAHLSILISVVWSLCVIGSMLASLQMSSFLMWSFLVSPQAHLSILKEFVMYLQKSHYKCAQPCNDAPCEGPEHGRHSRA